MLFNSVEFLFFFIGVTVLFFIISHQFRWILLLVASCFFYMFFKPEYILILAFTIVADYSVCRLLESARDESRRKTLLAISVVVNVGVLVFFKYFNFLSTNFRALGNYFGYDVPFPLLDIVLPIGLSFHTFQAMSYTFEVYRRRFPAERHLGIFALYVMFYPQLVAGPIERPQNIIPQFRIKQEFSFDNAGIGLNLIFWGLFKKVVVADRLATYVNGVFSNLNEASSLSCIIAVFFFSFQIYCDFSGYSDIARGTAKVMGYDLMINFKQPYLSRSISEFWTRWHISLSSWFRDYLYIPLGGNRKGQLAMYRNLFVVFLLSGVWHGANWTFLIWGLIHALLLITSHLSSGIRHHAVESSFLRRYPNIHRWLDISFVFIVVSFAWIFFRAETVQQAFAMVSKIAEFQMPANLGELTAGIGALNFAICFFVLGVFLSARRVPNQIEKHVSVRLAIATILSIIFLGPNDSGQFIYFQF